MNHPAPTAIPVELREPAELFDARSYPDRSGLPDDWRPDRALRQLAWLVPTLVMTAVGLYRVDRPSLWADELATWGIVTLPAPDLWRLLPQSDAALGPYYVLLRGWTSLTGTSDLALRLPSVLAMGLAAGVVARTGTRVATPRLGLLAGLILAALPVSSRYAQEARPYALALLGAATATLLLVRFLEKGTAKGLTAYGLAVAATGLAHPLALTVLTAHAFVVVALRPSLLLRWTGVTLVAALPSVPTLWLALQQRELVAWIAISDNQEPLVFLRNFFGEASAAAAVFALAVLSISGRRPSVLFSAWALLPPVVFLVFGQLAGSLWLPRYLLFVLPAWALLAALSLARAPGPAAACLLVLLAVAGQGEQERLRQDDGHGLDGRAVDRILSSTVKPGDAVVYGEDDPGARWMVRDVIARYVPDDRRPEDVLLRQPQRTAGAQFAVLCRPVASCLGSPARLWLVRAGTHPNALDGLGADYAEPVRDAYVVEQSWSPTGLTVALLVRKRT